MFHSVSLTGFKFLTLDVHFQRLVFFFNLAATQKFFTAEVWENKNYMMGTAKIMSYKSVTYLYHVSVI